MRILITGGAGFIGANLCACLCADRRIDSVVVLDQLTTGRRSNLAGLPVDFIKGSVLDTRLLTAAARSADAVVHLAAQVSVAASTADPMATHEANAAGTLNVLEAARQVGVQQVIVASSCAVYGDTDVSPATESGPTRPLSVYGSSKLAAEAYALAYRASLGVATLALRFFNVFGPLQRPDGPYGAVVPAFLSAAAEGRPITVYGDGTQTRDFIYVDSVCAVIRDAIARRVCLPLPVNVASGTSTSLTTLISTLEELTGRPIKRLSSAPRAGDIRDSHADVTLLRRTFPDVPIVSFADGLATTYRWFQSHTWHAPCSQVPTPPTKGATMNASLRRPTAMLDLGPAFPPCLAERRPLQFRHRLATHPALSQESIAVLADELSGESVTCETAEKPLVFAQGAPDPEHAKQAADRIRNLETNRSWMTLLNVEQHPTYRQLIDEWVDDTARREGIDPTTLRRRMGFIFASSPHSVTGAHFDIEHSLLLQLRGHRTLSFGTFPEDETREREVRRYWNGSFGRLTVMPTHSFDMSIGPGDGVYIPPYRPHWLRNGDETSLSLTITFFNRDNDVESFAQAFNERLRKLGMHPRHEGESA
ncbi:MAG: UDP-glucose 4-epimerase, partial [Pseudonocardiales bacterium]|nr:UDP-glucose 4-epimerase [Pseudonocardiales bacterium]